VFDDDGLEAVLNSREISTAMALTVDYASQAFGSRVREHETGCLQGRGRRSRDRLIRIIDHRILNSFLHDSSNVRR
jgi:hypothetical protein